MPSPPVIDGVSASRFQLPPGPWPTVLEALCACFPRVERGLWLSRFARGRVLDAAGEALHVEAPYRVGADIHYYREVVDEPLLAVEDTLLHVDADLIVVDKPHFLPVVPGGGYVTQTLLARLIRRFGDIGIAPLHRLDRLTAGVVLFSANPATRARYQAFSVNAPSRNATRPSRRRCRRTRFRSNATPDWRAASRSSACANARAYRMR